MNWKNPVALLIIAVLLTTSCAKRSTKKKEVEAPVTQSESADTSLEFLDSFEDDDLFSMQSEDVQYEGSAVEIQTEVANAPILGAGGSTYTVQEGDTLMFVAYKVYGDYRQWPSLASRNNLVGQAALKAGDVLSLDPSRVKTMPRKAGSVYLIKVGDSLSKISMANYGTYKQWEPLWKHNAEMIIDPNIIFAGFQMHLLPDNQFAFNQ